MNNISVHVMFVCARIVSKFYFLSRFIQKKISWLPPRFAWKLYVIIHGRYFCFTPQRQMLAWDSVVGAGRERESETDDHRNHLAMFFSLLSNGNDKREKLGYKH